MIFMARRKKGTKKVDKSKQRKTYNIVAPSLFGNKVVGELLSSKSENLLMRIIPLSLVELQDGKLDPSSLYTTVKLRVVSVGEDNANTSFAGHDTAFSYLRSLARRRKSVIHEVVDVSTKDNKRIRFKTMLVTFRKVSSVLKKNVRAALVENIKKKASTLNKEDLLREVLLGKFAKEVAKEVNKITPVTHLVIRKSEVVEDLKDVAKAARGVA
ncbi:MAG: hypothetical protein D6769_02360 [Methanobacteriota archaeon]|nr:MAG: hypothetical protein D6769_02360 [Euryarchaeota archaeon]